nr:MAG TPA: hypothetical protein [Bacteriophage sp.]
MRELSLSTLIVYICNFRNVYNDNISLTPTYPYIRE